MKILEKLVGGDAYTRIMGMVTETLPPERHESFLLNLIETIRDPSKAIVEAKWRWEPVGVREFMESEFYLGKKGEVYAKVMEYLEEINTYGKYDEIVLTGGIGSAKTTLAVYSQAYQLYLMSCMPNPHAAFGLDSSSEIKIIFQSLNATLAKGVDYARFKALIEKSPYFREHFMYDQGIESMLKFPFRIEVEPLSGAETGAIGQNVIGGVIDEINFMAVTENSKMAEGGGTYDQATQLYNTIARRRKSRFMVAGGSMPGLLCIVSSKKTPGQFTDKKEEEAKTDPRIFIYDKRVWDIKSEDSFCGDKFAVYIGGESKKPFVYEDEDREPTQDEIDEGMVDYIPVEFRKDFNDDITKALRDIAGKSTLAISPFLPDTDAVAGCFGKVESIFKDPEVELMADRPVFIPTRVKNTEHPRWCHIDLGLTSDKAGFVIGHVDKFVDVERGNMKERWPNIRIDGSLAIRPPNNGEIDFAEIRLIIYKLREAGLPIRWVSFDSFQSADSMQILRKSGFTVGYVSMDVKTTPYDITKAALYDSRVQAPHHRHLQRELLRLERNFKSGKIDHPSNGSKDVADAFAGVIYGLSTRREIWGMHNEPLISIPDSLGSANVGKQGVRGVDYGIPSNYK